MECFTNPKNNNSHGHGYAADNNDGTGKKSKSKSKSKKGGSSTSINTSTAAMGKEVEHNPYTHGYRVCDSSRFVFFPSLRGVTMRKVQAASIEHTGADIAR